jgi:hypothetical protein
MGDELRDVFERRAARSAGQGSDEVLAAARRLAGARHRSSTRVPAAIGATTLALAVVAAGLAIRDGDGEEPAPSDRSAAPRELVIAQNASALVSYGDCAGLLDDIKAQALARVGPWGLGVGGLFPYGEGDVFFQRGGFADGRFAPPAPGVSTGEPARRTSGTNTQEVDIDEPDLVETDGERLFDVRDGSLRVVDIDAARETSTTPLGLVNLLGATLVGDSLVVFANEPSSRGESSGDAKVVVVEVAGAPVIQQRLTIDGSIVDARVVDGRVHLVTVSAPGIDFTFPGDGAAEAAQEAATEANRERIRASTLADWLPGRVVTDATGTVTAERELLTDCAAVRHPKEFAGFDQTSLVTLDLGDLASSVSTSVQAASLLVYGSSDSLYTATTTFPDVDPEGSASRPVVGSNTTDLHRFALDDVPVYAGSGRVEGYVGDQFGLSEHDRHLRVASTTFQDQQESRVTVLRIEEGELVETGVVDGLGPGEQVKGVRFIGDQGYVVTFRQTDPLYVLDLRNPRQPTLAGELEIPGFSAYLHPVGDGLLLGIGFDGTEAGQLPYAAASLFDVRDPAHPTRLDVQTFRSGGPMTANDHHAFTWWEDTATAYFPVGVGVLAAGQRVEVVHVAGDHLEVVAEIAPKGDGAPPEAGFDRTVVIGDRLVVVSPEGVQVLERESLEPLAWVPYR